MGQLIIKANKPVFQGNQLYVLLLALQLRGGAHSNMKVTGMCLPENESWGFSMQDFVEKRGSLGVGSKEIGSFFFFFFFGVNFPKYGSFGVSFTKFE